MGSRYVSLSQPPRSFYCELTFLSLAISHLLGRRAEGKRVGYTEEYRICTKIRQEMRYCTPRGPKEEVAALPSEPRIMWSCYEHTFPKKMGDEVKEYNVASYYKDIYDVTVEFPNMPIICVGAAGYFPIEFLFQERSRVGGNAPDKVMKVLAYHDANAGIARIHHVRDIKNMAYREGGEDSLLRTFENFHLHVEEEPVDAPAVQLPPPSLEFKNETLDGVPKGSWNLKNKKFYR